MTLFERDRINFEEGREEGRAEGRAEGIEEGKTVGREESAKALLDILDDETISKKLNIPLERVKELRNESLKDL